MNLSKFTTRNEVYRYDTRIGTKLESPFCQLSYEQKDCYPVLGSIELFNHLGDGTKQLFMKEFKKHITVYNRHSSLELPITGRPMVFNLFISLVTSYRLGHNQFTNFVVWLLSTIHSALSRWSISHSPRKLSRRRPRPIHSSLKGLGIRNPEWSKLSGMTSCWL